MKTILLIFSLFASAHATASMKCNRLLLKNPQEQKVHNQQLEDCANDYAAVLSLNRMKNVMVQMESLIKFAPEAPGDGDVARTTRAAFGDTKNLVARSCLEVQTVKQKNFGICTKYPAAGLALKFIEESYQENIKARRHLHGEDGALKEQYIKALSRAAVLVTQTCAELVREGEDKWVR